MDRERAFVEYGRILKDAADWIAKGYRGESDAEEDRVRPPDAAFGSDATAVRSAEHAENVGMPVNAQAAMGTAVAPAERTPPARLRPVSGSAAGRPPATDAPVPVSGADGSAGGRDSELREIAGAVRECRDCNLYLIRENTVPGAGSVGAVLMIVTPPPVDGAGENDGPLPPFEAEYLGKWLAALGLDLPHDVFITPAVKCRTPGGRPPHAEEAAACSGHLRRQYKAVRPKAVLALGDAACGALTGSAADFPALVGRDWTWGAVPALVLWTPAEVLANPSRLRKPVWDALQRLKASWNAAGTGL